MSDTFTGTLEREDLGAGGYVLVLPDGERAPLVGDVPSQLVGQRVRVRGRRSAAMGFLMTGAPSIEAQTIEPA